jgi:hypothetical protein
MKKKEGNKDEDKKLPVQNGGCQKRSRELKVLNKKTPSFGKEYIYIYIYIYILSLTHTHTHDVLL